MAFLLAETVFNDARQKLINGTARFFLKERLELQNFFSPVHRKRMHSIPDCHIYKPFFQKAETCRHGQSVT